MPLPSTGRCSTGCRRPCTAPWARPGRFWTGTTKTASAAPAAGPWRTNRASGPVFAPVCNIVRYPRVSPAVIMRITRGREILLGRQAFWPQGMYSVLAGFVEPGENAEEAVAREVREEAGIEVGNVRYFASQPWALPDSLMLGFTAEYVSGELLTDSPGTGKSGLVQPGKRCPAPPARAPSPAGSSRITWPSMPDRPRRKTCLNPEPSSAPSSLWCRLSKPPFDITSARSPGLSSAARASNKAYPCRDRPSAVIPLP